MLALCVLSAWAIKKSSTTGTLTWTLESLHLLCSVTTNTARKILGSSTSSFWLSCFRQTSTFDQPCYSFTPKNLSFWDTSPHYKNLLPSVGGLRLCALKERHWNCKGALACAMLPWGTVCFPDLRVDCLVSWRLRRPEGFLLQPV